MDFETLEDFLRNRMRMAHIYQPVMIKALLEHGGTASVEDIARALLSHDQSQVEYYQTITNNMVGRVLRNHDMVRKEGRSYHLAGFESLSADEREQLTALCNEKVAAYLERRGAALWDHRRKSTGYISGTLRYEVFKRAGFHCELCGTPADETALQVDHIIPRAKDGEDTLANLQALCFRCNAMKRDRDDTDFRAVRESYQHRVEGCPFCDVAPARIEDENALAFCINDGFPVTEGHTLVIPRRHVASYFELYQSEINAINQLLQAAKERSLAADKSVRGFNIGINVGETAGQTVFHCHVHLMPRRVGDVDDPRGGVRHLIPGKGFY